MIFQNGCSKDHILFKKKKEKKKREKEKPHFQKKKKNHSFTKSSPLELRLDLILYKRDT